MPNHVHILIQQKPGHSLAALVTKWKSISARRINKYFNRQGKLWMPGYWDRFIRDGDHYQRRIVEYIQQNPVRARLTNDWQAWPWRL